MSDVSTILITGASSGIGAALAKSYAKPGVTLGLLGRNETRLAEVAATCSKKGARVLSASIDVRDKEKMEYWIVQFDSEHPVDLLIANAGISAGLGGGTEPSSQVCTIFAVNVDGVFNSVLPIVPLMQKRGHGSIAIMSSLAGIRGLPSCPAYSASKAAVRYYAEGLRGVLKKEGINVSVICPGYIKTPMTDVNTFPMPFMMSAEKAADIIRRGIAKKRGRIAFPLALYIPLWLLTCLSNVITDPFFAALPTKTAMQEQNDK